MHRHEHGRTIVALKGGTLTIKKDTGEPKKLNGKQEKHTGLIRTLRAMNSMQM